MLPDPNRRASYLSLQAEAIASGAPASKLHDIARKGGFKTLWEIGLDAVKNGATSPEELIRVAGEE